MRLLLERRKIGERKVETMKNLRLFGLKKENVILMGPEAWTYQNIISPSREANQRENRNIWFGRKCHHHNIPIFLSPLFHLPTKPNSARHMVSNAPETQAFGHLICKLQKKRAIDNYNTPFCIETQNWNWQTTIISFGHKLV